MAGHICLVPVLRPEGPSSNAPIVVVVLVLGWGRMEWSAKDGRMDEGRRRLGQQVSAYGVYPGLASKACLAL